MKYLLVLIFLTALVFADIPGVRTFVPYNFKGIEIRETEPLHDGLDYLMEQKREAEEERVQQARKEKARERKAANKRKKPLIP